jgi:O-methyltransferase involved in polyketide biosynthesis
VPRTDNDTWDLASSVGVTATGVAAARALASSGLNPLINDPFAEQLVKAVGTDVFTKTHAGRSRCGADDLYAANGFTLPDDEQGALMTDVKYITATLH